MKKLTTEEFINKAKEVHGDKYDYSKIEYVNMSTPVIIVCKEHGEFSSIPFRHIYQKRGCQQCKKNENFIKKAVKVHGNKYDYSKVNYINLDSEVCIIHPEYGEFYIKPFLHLQHDGFLHGNKKFTYGYCKYLASKYSSLYVFAKKNETAYKKSKDNGWLSNFTWLENDIKGGEVKSQWVYSYEFSDKSVYVGLTNDIGRRDWQHRNRCYHTNGLPKQDTVLDYSVNNNIEIPEIKVIKSGLTRKESQVEEQHYIEKYRIEGWNVINKNKGGSLGAVYNFVPWTKESIIEESKKYKTKEDMRNGSRTAYNKMMNMGLGKICFPNGRHVDNMSKKHQYTEEFLQEMKKKYPLKKDLRKNEGAVHHWLCKHKRIDEFYPDEVWKK